MVAQIVQLQGCDNLGVPLKLCSMTLTICDWKLFQGPPAVMVHFLVRLMELVMFLFQLLLMGHGAGGTQ